MTGVVNSAKLRHWPAPSSRCQSKYCLLYCALSYWVLSCCALSYWGLMLCAPVTAAGHAQENEQPSTVIENPFDLLPRDDAQPSQVELKDQAVPNNHFEVADDFVPQTEAIAEQRNAPAKVPGSPVEPSEKFGVETFDDSPALVDAVNKGAFERALIIDFEGAIFGAQASYLKNRLDRAKRHNVDLILLRLTSPGGELETSLELARRLRDIDWATTIAFIPQESISGGAIIALGCDRIYMTPRALIGDAGPIRMGVDGQFQHAEEKIVSYLSSAINELAESKGRPGALAQAMVDRSIKVFVAKDKQTGGKHYLTQLQTQDAELLKRYEVGPEVVETGENRFLTVNGNRALELDLAEGVFESEAALRGALNIASVVETKINWVDKLVFLLNRPWLTGLLLIAGLIGMYIELAAPGISFAGMASVACFGIFFWSHALGGTSGWLELMLFVLGIGCLLIELFMLPGFGVFGLSGILLVLLSLIMATQDFILPNTQLQWAQLQTNTLIVLGSLVIVGILFMGQLLLLDSIPGLKRFQLHAPGENPMDVSNVATLTAETEQAVDLPGVGQTGFTESVLRPSGKVLFDQRLIDVISEGDFIDPGIQVEVIRREGNRIVVRKLS